MTQLNILNRLTKHKAVCACSRCAASYTCNTYDARKSKVGDLCSTCKTAVSCMFEPTQEKLNSVFNYDPITGIVTHKHTTISGNSGDVVGYPHNEGYITAYIGRKEYLLHRLIWLMQTGEWPVQVDHIDHNRSNNAWLNLRNVVSRDNQMNMTKRVSKLGIQGVRQLKSGKYHAYIIVNRKQLTLGSYEELSDAVKARKEAELKYGFHENHGT